MPDTTSPDTNVTATADALRGHWQAVMSWHGDVLPEYELAYLDDNDEVDITIRRGTALPDTSGRLPGQYATADLIRVAEDMYVGERRWDDGLNARWLQAQAMAAGLNTAAEAVAR